jgi:hypothetical protein
MYFWLADSFHWPPTPYFSFFGRSPLTGSGSPRDPAAK